jgi:hypothetical protein
VSPLFPAPPGNLGSAQYETDPGIRPSAALFFRGIDAHAHFLLNIEGGAPTMDSATYEALVTL